MMKILQIVLTPNPRRRKTKGENKKKSEEDEEEEIDDKQATEEIIDDEMCRSSESEIVKNEVSQRRWAQPTSTWQCP